MEKDRKELIEALRCITEEHPVYTSECKAKGCKYAGTDCVLAIPEDAVKYLESLEPRVLSLKEIRDYSDVDINIASDKQPLYIEYYTPHHDWLNWVTPNVLKQLLFSYREVENYGKKTKMGWRCWTFCPSDEERKAAKWDG